MKRRVLFSVLMLGILSLGASGASLKLPAILGDHMVLQQKSFAKLWGWAEPEQVVKVTTSWNEKTYRVVADQLGNWQVRVATGKAGGPYTVTIQADITRLFTVAVRYGWSNTAEPKLSNAEGLPASSFRTDSFK